jgi:hypothetical protein
VFSFLPIQENIARALTRKIETETAACGQRLLLAGVQTGPDFWSAALAKISEPWLTPHWHLAPGGHVELKQRLKGGARDQQILFFGVG